MNNLFKELQQNSSPLSTQNQPQSSPSNPMMQMINMIKNSGNPEAMLQTMMQQNPQMKGIMQVVNRYGGDPQKAFYAIAKQRGINPNDILSMFK